MTTWWNRLDSEQPWLVLDDRSPRHPVTRAAWRADRKAAAKRATALLPLPWSTLELPTWWRCDVGWTCCLAASVLDREALQAHRDADDKPWRWPWHVGHDRDLWIQLFEWARQDGLPTPRRRRRGADGVLRGNTPIAHKKRGWNTDTPPVDPILGCEDHPGLLDVIARGPGGLFWHRLTLASRRWTSARWLDRERLQLANGAVLRARVVWPTASYVDHARDVVTYPRSDRDPAFEAMVVATWDRLRKDAYLGSKLGRHGGFVLAGRGKERTFMAADVEDVMVDAYAQAHSKWGELSERGDMFAWLKKAAKDLADNHRVRRLELDRDDVRRWSHDPYEAMVDAGERAAMAQDFAGAEWHESAMVDGLDCDGASGLVAMGKAADHAADSEHRAWLDGEPTHLPAESPWHDAEHLPMGLSEDGLIAWLDRDKRKPEPAQARVKLADLDQETITRQTLAATPKGEADLVRWNALMRTEYGRDAARYAALANDARNRFAVEQGKIRGSVPKSIHAILVTGSLPAGVTVEHDDEKSITFIIDGERKTRDQKSVRKTVQRWQDDRESWMEARTHQYWAEAMLRLAARRASEWRAHLGDCPRHRGWGVLVALPSPEPAATPDLEDRPKLHASRPSRFPELWRKPLRDVLLDDLEGDPIFDRAPIAKCLPADVQGAARFFDLPARAKRPEPTIRRSEWAELDARRARREITLDEWHQARNGRRKKGENDRSSDSTAA